MMPSEEFIMRTALLQGAGTLFASGQIHCGHVLKALNAEIAVAAKLIEADERDPSEIVRRLCYIARESQIDKVSPDTGERREIPERLMAEGSNEKPVHKNKEA